MALVATGISKHCLRFRSGRTSLDFISDHSLRFENVHPYVVHLASLLVYIQRRIKRKLVSADRSHSSTTHCYRLILIG